MTSPCGFVLAALLCGAEVLKESTLNGLVCKLQEVETLLIQPLDVKLLFWGLCNTSIAGNNTQTAALVDVFSTLSLKHIDAPGGYFELNGGALRLPDIQWDTFRGYTFTVWLCLPTGAQNSSRCSLFVFSDAKDSKLECFLTLRPDAPHYSLLLRSSTPARLGSTVQSVGGALSGIAPGRWFHLTVRHSLPYLVKSRASCFVNGRQQFSGELLYPTPPVMRRVHLGQDMQVLPLYRFIAFVALSRVLCSHGFT